MRTLNGCLSQKLNWETLVKRFEGENVLLVPSLPSEAFTNVPPLNSSGVLVAVGPVTLENWRHLLLNSGQESGIF